jgi:hypothetical protein
MSDLICETRPSDLIEDSNKHHMLPHESVPVHTFEEAVGIMRDSTKETMQTSPLTMNELAA